MFCLGRNERTATSAKRHTGRCRLPYIGSWLPFACCPSGGFENATLSTESTGIFSPCFLPSVITVVEAAPPPHGRKLAGGCFLAQKLAGSCFLAQKLAEGCFLAQKLEVCYAAQPSRPNLALMLGLSHDGTLAVAAW